MIYLDNNATTCLDPEVKQAQDDLYHQRLFGNPSSTHRLGQRSKGKLLEATRTIAQFFCVSPEEIIFTSGATEALNLVIKGISIAKGHIISSAFEHACVLQSLKAKEQEGFLVSYLKNSRGMISLRDIESAVRDDTKMIVLMAVNNETGIKNEIFEIADFCEKRGIVFIVDGVALLGKELFSLSRGISSIVFSGHKIHGPLGIGFAIVRKGIKLMPQIVGGIQQRGKRSGTENLPGIIGLAKAHELLNLTLPQSQQSMEQLRDQLEEGILSFFPTALIHGKQEKRIVNVSNISFPGIDGETLLVNLDLEGVAVSHGAACMSGGLELSHVLLNMGISPQMASSSIRFSLSRFTTQEEIEKTLVILKRIFDKMHFNFALGHQSQTAHESHFNPGGVVETSNSPF